LSSLATVTTSGKLAAAPHAQLVHCGNETCLRISGHRAHPAIAIRIAGQNLAVVGERSWRATVPLSTARDWVNASAQALKLTMIDTLSGAESVEAVPLPPGAFGNHVELATLVVRAY
jgi:hypothetical protein